MCDTHHSYGFMLIRAVALGSIWWRAPERPARPANTPLFPNVASFKRFDGLALADTLEKKDADPWCGV